ncbi:NUDIX hydrolase [Ensifer soli]|uniref:hydrolase n=1 Tax=Ciceribacter sp. sgz301302 TaxID=3342379 RepID=UPI0035BA9A4C
MSARVPATGPHPTERRPAIAASLVLLDRSQRHIRVLLGRRSQAHAFMPGYHVFPGGRRDPGDHRLPHEGALPPADAARLKRALRTASPLAAAAVAIAAWRELHEETGLCPVGENITPGPRLPFLPDLTNMRYMARAITPPGHVRRYDTHFFVLFADAANIDITRARSGPELEDIGWHALDTLSGLSLAGITQCILEEVRARLRADPSLTANLPVPVYRSVRQSLVRDLL